MFFFRTIKRKIMKKFMVHYHAPAEAMAQMANATDEQKAEGMKPWLAWQDKMGDRLVEMGSPMMGAHRLSPDGSDSQIGSEVTGYSIVRAEDMEAAKSLLRDHPHLQWTENVAIEVFEMFEM